MEEGEGGYRIESASTRLNLLILNMRPVSLSDWDLPFSGYRRTLPVALSPVPVSFKRAKCRIPGKIQT